MAKKVVRITESELRDIIGVTLKRYLSEGRSSGKLDSRLRDMVFVSYGSTKYDSSKVRKPDLNDFGRLTHQIYINKPMGGLWASPLGSKWGWGDFCSHDAFNLETLDKHFLFRLKSSANIYVIDNIDDLKRISTSRNYYGNRNAINLFELVGDYDGVFVSADAVGALRYCADVEGLASWDVESLCIWNKDMIEPIEENAFDYMKVPMHTDNPHGPENSGWDDEDRRRYLQMQNDYMKYGNQNVKSDMSSLFNGEHPALNSQLHGNSNKAKLARKFNGTIKSGME